MVPCWRPSQASQWGGSGGGPGGLPGVSLACRCCGVWYVAVVTQCSRKFCCMDFHHADTWTPALWGFSSPVFPHWGTRWASEKAMVDINYIHLTQQNTALWTQSRLLSLLHQLWGLVSLSRSYTSRLVGIGTFLFYIRRISLVCNPKSSLKEQQWHQIHQKQQGRKVETRRNLTCSQAPSVLPLLWRRVPDAAPCIRSPPLPFFSPPQRANLSVGPCGSHPLRDCLIGRVN